MQLRECACVAKLWMKLGELGLGCGNHSHSANSGVHISKHHQASYRSDREEPENAHGSNNDEKRDSFHLRSLSLQWNRFGHIWKCSAAAYWLNLWRGDKKPHDPGEGCDSEPCLDAHPEHVCCFVLYEANTVPSSIEVDRKRNDWEQQP